MKPGQPPAAKHQPLHSKYHPGSEVPASETNITLKDIRFCRRDRV